MKKEKTAKVANVAAQSKLLERFRKRAVQLWRKNSNEDDLSENHRVYVGKNDSIIF